MLFAACPTTTVLLASQQNTAATLNGAENAPGHYVLLFDVLSFLLQRSLRHKDAMRLRRTATYIHTCIQTTLNIIEGTLCYCFAVLSFLHRGAYDIMTPCGKGVACFAADDHASPPSKKRAFSPLTTTPVPPCCCCLRLRLYTRLLSVSEDLTHRHSCCVTPPPFISILSWIISSSRSIAIKFVSQMVGFSCLFAFLFVMIRRYDCMGRALWLNCCTRIGNTFFFLFHRFPFFRTKPLLTMCLNAVSR